MVTQNKTHSRRPSRYSPRKKIAGYDKDFCKWTRSQARLLKTGDLENLDIPNLIEEIESLGRSDRRSLKSHLIILLQHLLKKKFQPERKESTNSWNSSISNSRLEINLILDDSPSLKRELNTMLNVAYTYARKKAALETGIKESKLPETCPWTFDDAMTI